MANESRYRLHARQVISRVMADTKGKPVEEIRKALRAAYPFQAKSGFAYKCWCSEQRKALQPFDLKKKERDAFKQGSEPTISVGDWKFTYPHKFPWLYVRCPWCKIATTREPIKGCIVCGPVLEQLQIWLSDPYFMGMLIGCRENPQPFRVEVFADWVDDRGENYGLADALRVEAVKIGGRVSGKRS